MKYFNILIAVLMMATVAVFSQTDPMPDVPVASQVKNDCPGVPGAYLCDTLTSIIAGTTYKLGEYDPLHPYVVNEMVAYLGNIYTCILNGTGQQPNISPLYWTLYGGGGGGGTLDDAYDFGGAHLGRLIYGDAGFPVYISGGGMHIDGLGAADGNPLTVRNDCTYSAYFADNRGAGYGFRADSGDTGIGFYGLNTGTGLSFRMDDRTGDTTPFFCDADGRVGINVGSAWSGCYLDINGNANLNDLTNYYCIDEDPVLRITPGSECVHVGEGAGAGSGVGISRVTSFGYRAGQNTTGIENTFLGSGVSSSGCSGARNTIVGSHAGSGIGGGSDNTVIGMGAGGIAKGEGNTFLGTLSGESVSNSNYNTYLGFSSGRNATGSGNIFIGNQSGLNCLDNDTLYIDNSSTSTPLIFGDFNKNDILINGTLGVTSTFSMRNDQWFWIDTAKTRGMRFVSATPIVEMDYAHVWMNETNLTLGEFDGRASNALNVLGGDSQEAKILLSTVDGSGSGNSAALLIDSDSLGGGDGARVAFLNNNTLLSDLYAQDAAGLQIRVYDSNNIQFMVDTGGSPLVAFTVYSDGDSGVAEGQTLWFDTGHANGILYDTLNGSLDVSANLLHALGYILVDSDQGLTFDGYTGNEMILHNTSGAVDRLELTSQQPISMSPGIYIIPRSASPTVADGTIYYDSDDGKFWFYENGAWVSYTALPSGSTSDSTLRWDGAAWVENTYVLAPASGDLKVKGGVLYMSPGDTQALFVTRQLITTGTMFVGDGGASINYVSGNDGRYNMFTGIQSGTNLTVGWGNSSLGYNSLHSLTTDVENTGVGMNSLYSLGNLTNGERNTALGGSTMYYLGFSAAGSGEGNLAAGYGALQTLGYVEGGDYNTAVGTEALASLGYITCGGDCSGSVGLGYRAGFYETEEGKLFIDAIDRTSEALGRTDSLVYGKFDAVVANQFLTVNGLFNVNGTITLTGVAVQNTIYGGDASGDTLNILANNTDSYPRITLYGNSGYECETNGDYYVMLGDQAGVNRFFVTSDAPSDLFAIDTLGDVFIKNNLTVGDGSAGVDYQIYFNGEDNQATLQWMEDEKILYLTDDFQVGGGNLTIGAASRQGMVDFPVTSAGTSAIFDVHSPSIGSISDTFYAFRCLAGPYESSDRYFAIIDSSASPQFRFEVKPSGLLMVGTGTFTSNLTIGDGAAGVDYTITVNGETADGVLTYREDEDDWNFSGTGLQVTRLYLDGSYSEYFAWNSGESRGEFTDALYINGHLMTNGDIYIPSDYEIYLDTGATVGLSYKTATSRVVLSDADFQVQDNVIVGDGAGGVDFTLTFDGETSDGSVTYMEDERFFAFNRGISIADDAAYPPLNIIERSVVPTSPVTGDIYLDDGTNTGTGALAPCFRRYTGVGWENIDAHGPGFWDRTGADLSPSYFGDTVTADGGLTIGVGAVGTDYTLTFDGETSDGIIAYAEDERFFAFEYGIVVKDNATYPPLNITERSAAPSSPVTGDIYLDDGTNTGGGPAFRRYTGAAWENVDVGGGGTNYWQRTGTIIHPATSGDSATIDGNLVVGNNDTDDPTLTFAGVTNDGVWTWDESAGVLTQNFSMIPTAHNSFALGSDTVRWSNVYVAGGSLHLGNSGDEGALGYDVSNNRFTMNETLYMDTADVYLGDNYVAHFGGATNYGYVTYVSLTNRLMIDGAGVGFVDVYINEPLYVSGNISTGGTISGDGSGLSNVVASSVDILDDTYLYFNTANTQGFRWNSGASVLQASTNTRIGIGDAGIDYSLSFDGETNDGSLTYMEDEDRFDFGEAVRVGGNLSLIGGEMECTADSSLTFRSNETTTTNFTFMANNAVGALQYHSTWVESAGATILMYLRGDGALITEGGIYSGGNLQIGIGAVGVDYTLTFDGETSDGVLTWQEDERFLQVSGGGFKVADNATYPPLNLTARAAAPTTPVTGDIYLDDGTNTLNGRPALRRYNGSSWADIDGDNTREVFFHVPASMGTSMGNFVVDPVAGTGSARFVFNVPRDFHTLVSCVVVGFPATGTPGVGKDIDLLSNYCASGETYSTNSESDTTSTYTIPAVDTCWELNVGAVLTGIAAGDYVGLEVDHNSIGGSIRYIGIRLRYR